MALFMIINFKNAIVVVACN